MNYLKSSTQRDSLSITVNNTLSGNAPGTQTSQIFVLDTPINLSSYGLLPVSVELPSFSAAATVAGTATLLGRVNGIMVPLITWSCSQGAGMPVISSVISIPTTGILDAIQNQLVISSVSGGGFLAANWNNTLFFQFGRQLATQAAVAPAGSMIITFAWSGFGPVANFGWTSSGLSIGPGGDIFNTTVQIIVNGVPRTPFTIGSMVPSPGASGGFAMAFGGAHLLPVTCQATGTWGSSNLVSNPSWPGP